MTPHLHQTYVDGCYRCELNKDEVAEIVEHAPCSQEMTTYLVALDEVAEAAHHLVKAQRPDKWPDMHPEDLCHRCGMPNVRSWSVDSDRFNAAMKALGGGLGSHSIVCPSCFALGLELATGMTCSWSLVVGTPFRHLDRGDSTQPTLRAYTTASTRHSGSVVGASE